ncbi:39S ribosomal protein L2 mitochondrial [Biomphalaria pfeifferi]|uniref:39S ribosomal protein L2 mitochondrial n=1 Tax=Biomphalaria pfeifferi TaxID=112525 RepID=A0AAD8ASH2_BIOPF|nr:39S ribosomal protein L2 mitochondrial [Biomphalaria pfeifferi]
MAVGRLSNSSLQASSRNFHQSSNSLKNFNSRLPKNIKIGKFRFETHVDFKNYTLTPLKTAKTGGRGPDGRIWVHRIGGGDKLLYRMIDNKRIGPTEGEPLVEHVNVIMKDPCRSAHIAVVAGGDRKRYIIASEKMKEGDLIKTSGVLTAMPVRASDGDAYPIGSLPIGTLIHNVEQLPGDGGTIALAAGTSALYIRRVGNKCIVRMPSKREIILSERCMVVVGRVSNTEHHKTKKMKTAGESRWRGIRPKSGWWQRKDGYCGRKIRPIKPAFEAKPVVQPPEAFKWTV